MSNYIVNTAGRVVECTSREHAQVMIRTHGAREARPEEIQALRDKKAKKRSAARDETRAVAEKRVALDEAARRAELAAPDEEEEEGEAGDEEEGGSSVVSRDAAEAALRNKNKAEMISLAAGANITTIKSAMRVDEIRDLLIPAIMSGALPLADVI